MFREMYRAHQAITEEECIELLKSETRGVFAVIGDEGYPYASPINHFYNEEDHRLYFHGQTFGHKVDAMKANPKACYCVYGQDSQAEGDWAYYVKSVIIFGKVEIDEDFDHAMEMCRRLCEKFPCTEEYIRKEFEADADRTLVFSMSIEHMTGKLVHEA